VSDIVTTTLGAMLGLLLVREVSMCPPSACNAIAKNPPAASNTTMRRSRRGGFTLVLSDGEDQTRANVSRQVSSSRTQVHNHPRWRPGDLRRSGSRGRAPRSQLVDAESAFCWRIETISLRKRDATARRFLELLIVSSGRFTRHSSGKDRERMTPSRTLVVVGQGYVGLPVAIRAVEVGYRVIGIDVDTDRVKSLRAGVSYVDDISSEQLRAALDSGRFIPTTDYADVAGFDIAVITVPTPLKESMPDLSYMEQASASLAAHLKAGATVVLESTTYPGTTEELLVPILERGSGLVGGTDFYAGYSPERIDPGNKVWGFVETPKVVSGINAKSLEIIKAFYDDLVNQTVPVSTPKEAELTKLLENTFRHVNIALVNELAMFAHQLGVNVWESIDAASTKPFGFMRFTPGPGVGGHCLPVDPSYLSWEVRRKLGQSFRFVELANDINDHMPDYVIQRSMTILNSLRKSLNGSKVLLIGLSYKKNTGDIRESPSLRIIELLTELGADISGVDDHVENHRWPAAVSRVALSAAALAEADIAILLTDHDDFDLSLLADSTTPVLDTKNKTSGRLVERL